MAHILFTDTVTANTGDLEPTEGDARRSHTLRVGRYAQHFVDALQMDSNPVEYLLNKYPKVSALLSRARMASRQAEGEMMQAACQEWRKGTLLICRHMLKVSPVCVGAQDALPSKYSSALCCQRALGRAAEVASTEQGVQSGQQPL